MKWFFGTMAVKTIAKIMILCPPNKKKSKQRLGQERTACHMKVDFRAARDDGYLLIFKWMSCFTEFPLPATFIWNLISVWHLQISEVQ